MMLKMVYSCATFFATCIYAHNRHMYCVKHTDGTNIYHEKIYLNGPILNCVSDVGLNMCMNLCVRTEGCSAVNYDILYLYCYLLTGVHVLNETKLEESNHHVFVSLANIAEVSDL